MNLLYEVRERDQHRTPISVLIARAVRQTYMPAGMAVLTQKKEGIKQCEA